MDKWCVLVWGKTIPYLECVYLFHFCVHKLIAFTRTITSYYSVGNRVGLQAEVKTEHKSSFFLLGLHN